MQPFQVMQQQPGVPGLSRPPMPFFQPPPPPPNCIPGLEYLLTADSLFIRQCIEPVEVLLGVETKNAYQVFMHGYMLYWAQEESDFCERQCCGSKRPFVINIMNQFGVAVMRMVRPYRCDSCLCFCCLQEITIEAPVGRPIGKVTQNCNPCASNFTCFNEQNVPVMQINGPCCPCGVVEFIVLLPSGQVVGKVTKHWSGMLQEAFTDADTFGITFPANLPVEAKAIILGACFLIDFMYFEDSPGERH